MRSTLALMERKYLPTHQPKTNPSVTLLKVHFAYTTVYGMEWKSLGGVLIKHTGSKASSGNTTCSDHFLLAGTQECLHGE